MQPVERFEDIDWSTWQADEHATLCFVIRGDEILLIRKKRGLGAGKINGPGGRLEPEETPLDCAIRETQEELEITPTGVEACGELRFQFTDGYALHGYVFRASGLVGEPTETDEAIPLWTPTNAIPYDEMWEDDRYWIPHMFGRRKFDGRFLFDSESDAMLGYVLDLSN
jgi:8-oxo-dGTP diphosphatase